MAGVSADPSTAAPVYGEKIVAVEPGGRECVADADLHGRPRNLSWTWTSPNMEFAAVFVGVLAVEVFGLTFGQAVAAIVVGNVLAGIAHGVLSARGPLAGVPQMVLGHLAFERWTFPVLTVIFLVGGVVVLAHSDAGFVPAGGARAGSAGSC